METATPSVAKATLLTDLKHQGVILQKHSIISDIYSQSGPNAKSNEFQVHYWMLVFRHTFKDGGFFDVAVPTCYYNYEQFVTSAHIDFEMADVSTLSEKLTPIHNMIVNKILATSFKSDLEELLGLQFTPISVDVGTLHRHPGSSHSQRFSGTDLDANATNHGIVFPLKSGINKPSFSGILAVDSGICNVAHYEYRIVNGSYDTNDLTYVKGRCLALTLNDTYVAPTFSSLEVHFGLTAHTIPSKTKSDNSLVPVSISDRLTSLIKTLPAPNTQLVRSENVKIKSTTYSTSTWGGNFKSPAPYKLDIKTYQYGPTILAANLERHYDFHKIAYDKTKLVKMTLPELEAELTRMYNYKATPIPREDPKISGFTICTIPVFTDEELLKASRESLVTHLDALDTYYYGKQGPSILETEPEITNKELIDYILELYLNIYDEEQEATNGFNYQEFDFIG